MRSIPTSPARCPLSWYTGSGPAPGSGCRCWWHCATIRCCAHRINSGWCSTRPAIHSPVAAQMLRQSLQQIRRTFDPHEVDPALDQMVILGKSTGGQTVRMLAEPGGKALWNAVYPDRSIRSVPNPHSVPS